MPNGIFLTIGLNSVDRDKYDGWDGPLNACENDARDMATIAASAGFKGTTLLTSQATSSNVLSNLHTAAQVMVNGDMLVLTYSGHGGQIGDVNGEEEDGLDETWCLYDRMLIDDELYAMWGQFKPGVRILVFSDSCHSGTVVRMKEYANFKVADNVNIRGESHSQQFKVIPFEKSWKLYQHNKDMYDTLQYVTGPSEKASISASVILISGCQDNQLSLDGTDNGLFTSTLKEIWNNGAFSRNYASFRDDIVKKMPPSQTPNYYTVGIKNPSFEAQKPFTL